MMMPPSFLLLEKFIALRLLQMLLLLLLVGMIMIAVVVSDETSYHRKKQKVKSLACSKSFLFAAVLSVVFYYFCFLHIVKIIKLRSRASSLSAYVYVCMVWKQAGKIKNCVYASMPF